MSDTNEINFTSSDTSRFATTHWSVVLTAGTPNSSRYRDALEELCGAYWFPLYAYLRKRGFNTHQAEDYTQAFFTQLLEKGNLKKADPARGKFRTFLLSSLKYFLADELDRARALKRGGDRQILSFEIIDAENRYKLEATVDTSAEKLFERTWAMTILQRAFEQLQTEYRKADRIQLLDNLKGHLTGDQGVIPYHDIAIKLGMTEVAVKAAAHRLKQKYSELVRQEIGQTVRDPNQIDEEVRELFLALGD